MVTTVANASGAAAATTSGSGAAGRSTIAQNFDAFLMLLTTQLRNQSPLDPLDTNQFTQQLVQFASVEQQLRSNETLNALLTSTRAANVSTAASFVGMRVTADGATAPLRDGQAEWTLDSARDAQATIVIRDKAGSIVFTQNRALTSGAQTFTWDGRTSTGTPASDGDYTITVVARDTAGQSLTVKTEIAGRVDSIDLSEETPALMIGSLRVPLTQIRTVSRPDA